MKASIVEMEGLLRGKCVPAKMLVNESLAEYLVRQFDSLHERAEVAERERDELRLEIARIGGAKSIEVLRRDALALGAQQQKVVELPEPVKWPEIPFKYFSEEQVFSMLDAAGVEWEVKK